MCAVFPVKMNEFSVIQEAITCHSQILLVRITTLNNQMIVKEKKLFLL